MLRTDLNLDLNLYSKCLLHRRRCRNSLYKVTKYQCTKAFKSAVRVRVSVLGLV